MLRWLKEKKKSKKSRPDTPDDYGFKQQRLNQQGPQTEEVFDEKVYHIYEEIPDIPTPLPGPDFLNESFSNGCRHDTHHHHHHHHHQRPNDGPYMVVPIVGSQSQEAGGHRGGCALESRSAFSLVSEGEGRTAFTCAVIGRRRSSDHGSLATSSEPYEFTTGSSSDGGRGSMSDGPDAQTPPELPLRPWETTRTTTKVLSSTSSSSIGTSSTTSGHSAFTGGAWAGDSNGCQIRFLKRPVALPSAHSCQGSPDRKCCGGGCSAHGRRHDPARDCDSCYEYDVSTSSEESEQYQFYLSKVEENLMMKHKVQQIIHTMERSRQQKKSGCSRSRQGCRKNGGDESDDDCSAFRPPRKCQHRCGQHRCGQHRCGQTRCCHADPDEGTLADQSESENSSGYYESFSLADVALAAASGSRLDSAPNSRKDSSSACSREKSREIISHHRWMSCPTSCKCSVCAVSTRKAPVCGVRSLNLGHRREKSVDSSCKLLTQPDEMCTGLNSGSGSSGGASFCERARKRSCSREDRPVGERLRPSGVQGQVTTRCEAGQRGEANPQHKHCHSTLRQLREFSAKESSSSPPSSSSSPPSSSSSSSKEASFTVAVVHRDAEKASNTSPAEAATTTSSVKDRKEKSKKDRSHSKPHKKHRHRSSSKPRKQAAASEPAEDAEYEVPSPGEGLDTREVEEDDSEVYTPPPSVSDFVSRVAVPQPKLSCKAWKQDSSEIYSSRSRSNRLLSDLIVSNYDRQLFVRV